MPSCSDFRVTSASGAGGSNRASSYAWIARLPDFHHEIGRIFRMSEPGCANLRCGRDGFGARLLLYAEMNACSLRQRERFERAKCAFAEDGIDVADHETILAGSGARCT